MPTEDVARSLLAKAAATIEVDETAPLTLTGLPEPRARRWPVLAAAAAVVLAIGGGYLVAQQFGDDPAPTPAPSVDRPDRTDGGLGEGDLVPAADEVPGLIGYTKDEATALLEGRGLTVQVDKEPNGCSTPGIVTGSTPAVGTRFDPGDTVTIQVITPHQVIDCVGEKPWATIWALVRYARGLGDPQRPDLLNANMPWDVLNVIAGLVTQKWPGEASPRLQAAYEYDGGPCWEPVAGGNRLRVWVQIPDQGMFCPATSVLLSREDNGALARVQVATDSLEPADPLEPFLLTPERRQSAEAFIAWARDTGPAPSFPDRVRVMYGGGPAFGSTGWVNDPEDRTLYSGCSGAGFPDCGIDPVALLERHRGPMDLSFGRPTCADGGTVPKRFADAPQDVVRIEEREPSSCPFAWAVELWIDSDGVIYGVNQAGAPS